MTVFTLLLIIGCIIWGLKPQKKRTKQADFIFLICDDSSEIPIGQWYRLKHWKRFNFLRYQPGKNWTTDWKVGSAEEAVVGLPYRDGQKSFILYGDKPEFKVSLQRDPKHKHDKNAIIVNAQYNNNSYHLGYLQKTTAAFLRDEPDLDARLHSCELPANGKPFRLNITVLIRSAKWRKKHSTTA